MLQADQDRIAELFGKMNDVAVGHGDWLDVLHLMDRRLGVIGSAIEVIDKRDGDMVIQSTAPIDPADQRLYEERVHLVNPRFSLLPGMRVGDVAADRHIAPDIAASAGEYYDWLGHTGTRYFAGIKLFDTPDFLALVSVHMPESRGPIDAATEDLYTRLAPHIANALSVQQALAGRGDRDELFDGESGSGRAYALLGRDGRVLECSREFERSVAASGALTLRERRLGAARAADGAELAALIGSATEPGPTVEPLRPVRIVPPGARHGLLLRAVRLDRSREMFARLRPVAMLVLIDLDAPAASVIAELRSGWGLTPREADLAMLIGEGRRIDQAAAMLGISEQTARHHLKAVFRRMEIDRQTDLVRLVTRLGG